MAYRVLEIGDDVKVSCFGHEDHGQFGKVVGFVDGRVKVDLGGYDGLFRADYLLVSTGNPYDNIGNETPMNDDWYFEDGPEMSDGELLQSLLERVATLEKQMLDVLKLAA